MKGLINITGRIVAKSSALQEVLLSFGGERYRILYYHMVNNITPDYYFLDKGIQFDDFREQVLNYKRKFTFIPLSEALKRLENGKSLKRCISVTTDDGFRENYEFIAPFLYKENILSTFFLIDNCIDNKHLMWRNQQAYIYNKLGREKTYQLICNAAQKFNLPTPDPKEDIFSWSKRTFDMEKKDILTSKLWQEAKMKNIQELLKEKKPYMTLNQIKELVSKGFEIGAHSISHPFCDKLDYNQLKDEVLGSIRSISEKTGYPVQIFSYPFGNRASRKFEEKLIAENGSEIKALIGIKNVLKNKNPYLLERDLQETTSDMAAFRFFILPYFRKLTPMNNE